VSHLAVQRYLNQLQDLRKVSGTHREAVVREAFKDLLKAYGSQRNLVFVPEYEIESPAKERRYVDGALLHELRVPFGYWEAKDQDDDLRIEIARKFKRGYPRDNIIFEDSREAILYQNGVEVGSCSTEEVEKLRNLLEQFFAYERPEIAEFNKAVEQFTVDLPSVLQALRSRIDDAQRENKEFQKAAVQFLKHARETINPSVGEADIKEMLIQHILTEEIFAKVFNESQFHRENNIARELYSLEGKFFFGSVKRQTLAALNPYYAAICSTAMQISSHAEKQRFLKVIYENFYRVYNKKAADRLGVVYTPSELVRFMIHGAEWACRKHFQRSLIDRDVEILDPATGTGTFVCELLEFYRGQASKLMYKYKTELHANEVAILPYYVANLNIEATFAALTKKYEEFENLCFVDTLDNVAGLGIRSGFQHDLFGALTEENVERIKRQNRRKISVIIGNPPYNANQRNESENNKNRVYPRIDERIKSTYIAESNAQKTKVYDMYARFFRWATDRLHDDGILAFVTNRSFIDSRTFDGFRKCLADDFVEIYLIDLGGDVRANPRLSGTKHNVFGIQTGVAISICVKTRSSKRAKIFYARRGEMDTADDKLSWLNSTTMEDVSFEEVIPDKRNFWINTTVNDFDDLVPVANKQTKVAKRRTKENSIFKIFSLGIASNRDDWAFDFERDVVKKKGAFFASVYNRHLGIKKASEFAAFDRQIKWTSELERAASNSKRLDLHDSDYGVCAYRPFIKKFVNYHPLVMHRYYAQKSIYPRAADNENISINVYSVSSDRPLAVLAANNVCDLGFLKQGNGGTFSLPRFRYGPDGTRFDNVTDWGLRKFQQHYEHELTGKSKITKDTLFYYVYAVLHDPFYRDKYAINLKRDLPRIPLYRNILKWSEWGEKLMELHIGYMQVDPWPIVRHDNVDQGPYEVILKADKAEGTITVDTITTLTGIPRDAWSYLLGSRAPLQWILDQYDEKTPKDKTVAAEFHAYGFRKHKEEIIKLIGQVTRVSVETLQIIGEMSGGDR
jgi:predicted helicase